MALDGAFLYCLRQELLPLIGSRIQKIYQPTRDEMIFTFRGLSGAKNVLFSCAADRARVHITELPVENPKVPPMFCMLLRKRLGSGKLLEIRQDGLERVLTFVFACVNELGDAVSLSLICEIMGRYSNLILVDEDGKIIDSITRVDATMSQKRLVLPGIPYEAPPREDRLNFLTASPDGIRAAFTGKTGNLAKNIIKVCEGVSPILAREWAYDTFHGTIESADTLTEDQRDRLCFTIGKTRQICLDNTPTDTIVFTKDGTPKDFSFQPIHQYTSTEYLTKTYPSAGDLLDHFFSQRDTQARRKQRANDLFRVLLTASSRIQKRIAAQAEELDACRRKEEDKHFADLLSANLYQLKPGTAQAEVHDFYTGGAPLVSIPLDVTKTPAQNAQHYYTSYKKACTAEKMLTVQMEKGRAELRYLDSVLDTLSRAETDSDLEQIRLELVEQGYLRPNKKKNLPLKPLPPMAFTTSEGIPILVGRNNRQNDQLTLKIAQKRDIWFHTKDIPGSHVILQTAGATFSQQSILEAAEIAAYYSKAREADRVPVDYTEVRYVRKPNGAKPGMVIFTNQRTLSVKPLCPERGA